MTLQIRNAPVPGAMSVESEFRNPPAASWIGVPKNAPDPMKAATIARTELTRMMICCAIPREGTVLSRRSARVFAVVDTGGSSGSISSGRAAPSGAVGESLSYLFLLARPDGCRGLRAA